MLQSVLNFIKQKGLIVAFSVLCTIGLIKACDTHTGTIASTPLTLRPVTSYIDQNKVLHEQIPVQSVSKEEMQRITDSLRKTIKGKVQIKEVIRLVSITDTTFRDLSVSIVGPDTVEIAKIDSYVNAKAVIDLKRNSGAITLKLRDTLTEARTVKNRFLRPNLTFIDITNKSPYSKINAGSAIIVAEPKVLFVLGPSVTINPLTQELSWGISFTFNAIAIKCSK